MEWLIGCLLGLGLVLCVSPWLWPRTAKEERKPRRSGRVRDRLTQAGLPGVPPAAVWLTSVLLAVIAGGLALLLTGVLALVPVAAAAGGITPWLAIRARARAARERARAVWPDVVDHLVAGVRGGLPIPEALASIGTAGPELVRPQFAAFAADYRATGSFEYSVDRLKDALADPTADRILETLRMAREVGGTEITSVLRQLSSYLRTDLAIRGELVARQSWIVHAARLGLVAPWLVLLVLAVRPEAAAAYNTAGGVAIIIGGAVVTVIAYRVMLAIGRLPTERRWFA